MYNTSTGPLEKMMVPCCIERLLNTDKQTDRPINDPPFSAERLPCDKGFKGFPVEAALYHFSFHMGRNLNHYTSRMRTCVSFICFLSMNICFSALYACIVTCLCFVWGRINNDRNPILMRSSKLEDDRKLYFLKPLGSKVTAVCDH